MLLLYMSLCIHSLYIELRFHSLYIELRFSGQCINYIRNYVIHYSSHYAFLPFSTEPVREVAAGSNQSAWRYLFTPQVQCFITGSRRTLFKKGIRIVRYELDWLIRALLSIGAATHHAREPVEFC